MQKQLSQTFTQLPLNTFKKKSYPIPHFLFQTKLQRTPKNLHEIKKLIQSQQYQYLGQISEQRNLYCCKQKANESLVVVQIKEVGSKSNKNIYLSINLTPALKKELRKYFMLKNWKIQDKIYLQDEKGQSGLVMLEYNFVENNLRNYVRKVSELGNCINQQDVRKIFHDVAQSLCSFHLQSTSILDIRPETILLQCNKWFILPGDFTLQSKSQQFGSPTTKPINFRPLSPLYLSPLMYESYIKNDQSMVHNPYKSDVYSLGLVMWELTSVGGRDLTQVKNKLENRKEMYVTGVKDGKYLGMREKVIVKDGKAYLIPNVLKMMLEQEQDNRSYIVPICLSLNLTSCLYTRILPSFEQFFRKDLIDITSSRKKIQYPHSQIQYEGDTLLLPSNQLIKNGRGTITYNNQKVFDGEWKNNLPHGKCSVSFSQVWSYEGIMEEGRFNGQGVLSFNGIRVGGMKWLENLDEDAIISSSSKVLEYGYYQVCNFSKPQATQLAQNKRKLTTNQLGNITNTYNDTANKTFTELPGLQKTSSSFGGSQKKDEEYKLYFQQLSNNRSRYIINFDTQSTNIQKLKKLLSILLTKKLFLRDQPNSIQVYESVQYERYKSGVFDMIRIKCRHSAITRANSKQEDSMSKINSFITQEEFSSTSKEQATFFSRQSASSSRRQSTKLSNCQKQFPHTEYSSEHSQFYFIDMIFGAKTYAVILPYLLAHIQQQALSNGMMREKSFHQLSQSNETKQFILQELILSNCSLSEDEFRDVIQTGIKIQSINLSSCANLTDLAIKYLLQSISQQVKYNQSSKTYLHTLNLQSLNISNQLLKQLSYFSGLKQLKSLNLSNCSKLTNDKIAEFLFDQRLGNLEELNVTGLGINHRGLEKVIANGNLAKIKRLSIGSCHHLTQPMLIQFMKSDQMANLETLECPSTTIKDVFLQYLSGQTANCLPLENAKTPSLKKLNLSGSINLTIYGLSKYFLSKASKSLLSINLSNLDISDDFIQLLGKKNLLNPQLSQLNLSSCYKITDKSIKQLLKPQRLTYLTSLDLSKTNISNDTLFLLAQSTQRKLSHIKFYKCSKMNDVGFEKLLMSSAISKVRKLEIGGTSVRELFFVVLVGQKLYIDLEELYLNQCQQINEKGLLTLLSSKRMQQLRLLDLSNTKLTPKSIQAIDHNPYLKTHLIHIVMNNCTNTKNQPLRLCPIPSSIQSAISPANHPLKSRPEELACSPMLLKLSELDLSSEISGIERLFASPYIINLTKLQMKWQQCTKPLEELSKNLMLNSFKQLNLTGSKFDQTKLVQLLKSPVVKNLQSLNLSWTDITNQTLNAISTSQLISPLRTLNLSKCNTFNDKGLIKLLTSPKASLLTTLDLRSTLITNSSLESLAKSKHLKSLTRLVLRSCPNISQLGFREFFASGNCSTLRELDIGWTRVEGGIFAFMAKSKVLQLNVLKIDGLRNGEFQLAKFIESIAMATVTDIQANFAAVSKVMLQSLQCSKYIQALETLSILGYDFVKSQQRLNALLQLIQSINLSKLTNLKLTFTGCQQKIALKIFETIHKNLHVLEKLYIIGATSQIKEKAKKMFKKCEVIDEE